MITVGEAVVLGVVQGLTEFLPVSSSGHLAIAQRFMTPLASDETVAVDVALHLGTLLAVCAYFWADLWGMLRAFASPRRGGWRFRWVWLIALATIPAAAVGIPFESAVKESLGGSMMMVGFAFVVTGSFLYLASAVRGALRTEDTLTRTDALVVGGFQVMALVPGISRAGVTIAGGLFRQLRGDVATRLSFLMAIPVVGGAELLEAHALQALGGPARAPLLSGVAAAGITGFAAIWIVFRMMRAQRLYYLSYYLWTVGALVLVGTTVFGL
jgi:undecaprenyl-diphosphatase